MKNEKNSMLGKIMAKIVRLSPETLKALNDLIKKLCGNERKMWFGELEKFLREEKCWEVSRTFLKPISSGETLIIDACDGTELLSDAADYFYPEINLSFKEGKENLLDVINEKGVATGKTAVKGYKLAKETKYANIFGELSTNPEILCLTQHQIRKFIERDLRCRERRWLAGSSTLLFLFKSKGRFIVFHVNSYMSSRKFERDFHWLESVSYLSPEHDYFVIVPKIKK